MNNLYNLRHSGVGHADNPPGRGSGRYPWGSGKRSKQRYTINPHKQDNLYIRKIKRALQMTSFILDAKMTDLGLKKYSKQYQTGMTYLSQHDFDWQEVSPIYYLDGRVEYYPPAQIIDDYLKSGRENPYPKRENASFFDEMQKINPDFGSDGTTRNCMKTAATVEMNRRGYNVQAGRQSDGGDIRSIMNWFKDSTLEETSYDDLENTLTSFGDNSSGILRIQYKDTDAGHAVHWSIEDGKLQIEDGQNGRVYGSKRYDSKTTNKYFVPLDDPLKVFLNEYDVDTDAKCTFSRLDNCEPNFKNMADDSVIRTASSRNMGVVRNKISGRIVTRW